MSIRCITIDDTLFDLEALNDMIRRFPALQPQASFSSPTDALEFLKTHDTDLVFSDIEMPELSGLEIIKTLPQPPAVVYVSSHAEKALEGFELAALDFIEKPLNFERFAKCVQRCEEYFNLRKNDFPARYISLTAGEDQEFITIKDGHDLVRIPSKEIIYVEASGDFVNIITEKKKYLTLVNLKNMMAQIPPGLLMRCHKSYLVNPRFMERMSNRSITLINHLIIPMSGDYVDSIEPIFTGKWLIKRKAEG